ncbi:MAG TPA: HNH endonuclease [Candidatus Acidoferrales bacterium]|nr:HNH endonuclease [Candidatus Acidoferrales bacterium]
MGVMKRTVLQVNASYEPMSIISARRALTLITKGVAVVELPTKTMIYPGVYLPSVIRLRHFRKVPRRLQQVSRKNIFIRDGHRCMYCGVKAPKVVLELEHIIPKSRGGRNAWENLVAGCHDCNQKKRDRTPEEAGMTLIHRPLPQSIHTGSFILKQMGEEVNEWGPYLWNDSNGDARYQYQH